MQSSEACASGKTPITMASRSKGASPAAVSGLAAIDLDYRESRRVDQYGNQFRYRARALDTQGANWQVGLDLFFVTIRHYFAVLTSVEKRQRVGARCVSPIPLILIIKSKSCSVCMSSAPEHWSVNMVC